MNNKKFFFLIILVDVIMLFLLVHKQNKIIKSLYELQKLQEKKEELIQKQKELVLVCQKEQQLSSVQSFAQDKLAMLPITLKEVGSIVEK